MLCRWSVPGRLHRAAPFTAPGGLYQRWVDTVVHESDRPEYAPDRELTGMTRLCDFADGWTTPD